MNMLQYLVLNAFRWLCLESVKQGVAVVVFSCCTNCCLSSLLFVVRILLIGFLESGHLMSLELESGY